MYSFSLDRDEIQRLEEWQKTLDMDAYTGAIGGRFTYSFYPTGIGVVVKVRDGLSGEEIDLTDYGTW